MRQTKIVKLRSTGKGIQGTYDNIAHHAQEVEIYVKALEPLAPYWGFQTWKQGSNVHQFDTFHGASYTLRPVFKTGEEGGYEYIGIALALRVSRSVEHLLTQCTRLTDIPRLCEMMRLLAKPQVGIVNGSLAE